MTSDAHEPRTEPVAIGVDVAQATLEVWVEPAGTGWTVANDGPGIAALVERVRAHAPRLVVLEATGGYEYAAVAALGLAGVPVAV